EEFGEHDQRKDAVARRTAKKLQASTSKHQRSFKFQISKRGGQGLVIGAWSFSGGACVGVRLNLSVNAWALSESGRAQPHSKTLRSFAVAFESDRFWSAAVLCRFS